MQQHGVLTLYNQKTDRFEEIGTVQCCHCGSHTQIDVRGRPKGGWCRNCQGFICGPACLRCVPLEARLENLEAGRPELTPPKIIISGGWET